MPDQKFGALESAESALQMQLMADLGGTSWETFARDLITETQASDPLIVFCLLSVLPYLRQGTQPYTISPAVAEHASYHLLPLLTRKGPRPDARCALRLIHLANLAFVGFIEAATPALSFEDPVQMAAAQASMHRDTYRGTRYDFQTADLISQMQGRFARWYEGHVGITPERAVRLVQDLERVTYERLRPLLDEANQEGVRRGRRWLPDWLMAQARRWSSPQGRTPAPGSRRQAAHEAMLEVILSRIDQVLPVSLDDLHARGCNYSLAEWHALQHLIGMTGAEAAAMTSPREAKGKPVKVLPDDRVISLGATFVLDELHEALDRAVLSSSMAGKYAAWKGEWTELQAARLLGKVFGEQVRVGVDYPDPDARHQGTAEVDLMAWSGPYVLFAEVKARGFSAVHATGPVDPRRLRSDVQNNYGAAAWQADRASRYLQQAGERRFVERRSRRELRLAAGQVRQPVTLGVSLYHLAGLAQQAQGLGSAGVPVTPSVALADLELLCEFCEGPDVLIAYLVMRQQLLALQGQLQTYEPDLFGLFLQRRLTDYALRQPNALYLLLGGQDPFDAWARGKRLGVEDRTGTGLQGPPEVLWVLAELRRIGSPDSVQGAVHLLLGRSVEWAVLAQGVRRIKRGRRRPGHVHRVSLTWRTVTIHLLMRPETTALPDALRRNVAVTAPGHPGCPHLWLEFELGEVDAEVLRVAAVHLEPGPAPSDGA